MRKLLSPIISPVVDWFQGSERDIRIEKFKASLAQNCADDMYVYAAELVSHHPNDAIAIRAFFDGVRTLFEGIGVEDHKKTAMELAIMPLDPLMQAGRVFKHESIRTLIEICPLYAAERVSNYEAAIAFLDGACSCYREFPELSSEALKIAFDLINTLGTTEPEIAANLATAFYPHERVMFSDLIVPHMAS